ncbi:hypothetical protein [Pararhizobium antarcticum]|uniref:hypothetical protein n=1 Tax=Pararhizobium antarcticum TaxID=1798805 RepID=UPI000A68401D|nr:hypothetical protein [Pararhizobium antarcticum]
MTGRVYDFAIIGGSINGAGIARDVAGRGLFPEEMQRAHGGLRTRGCPAST